MTEQCVVKVTMVGNGCYITADYFSNPPEAYNLPDNPW